MIEDMCDYVNSSWEQKSAIHPGQKSQKGVTPPGNEGQTDHIQPKSKGGTNDPSNAQHLCRDCNIKKSDKLPNQQ
jgi:5-methylcytosine-specific restriction endonuclease McrA